jgi:hypothetical protein
MATVEPYMKAERVVNYLKLRANPDCLLFEWGCVWDQGDRMGSILYRRGEICWVRWGRKSKAKYNYSLVLGRDDDVP